MGPGALQNILSGLRLPTQPSMLVGLDVSDDAAVYQIDGAMALVQTVDFFPPIVDDPYTYGAIAAANALSDIYAMGARPLFALAIAGFPENLPVDVIRAILQGGADKVAEAGAALAGGHTVIDAEPKYGLCVTGMIAPDRILRKANAQVGDVLLLTKPLGTGIITTATKRRIGTAEHLTAAVNSMLRLNRLAAELAHDVGVHSATDITGFGLAGHAAELARNSGVGLRINAAALPALPGALEYAAQGIAPGGLLRNRQFLEQDQFLQWADDLPEAQRLLLCDPQTSGGLLLALPPADADRLEQNYQQANQACWRIGDVVAGQGIMVL